MAELFRRAATTNFDWHCSKADQEASYRQLPIESEHGSVSVIALRPPTNGKRYGLLSRALMFGDISAVLRYNDFALIIAELAFRLFGITTLSYFDDFGALLPASLSRKGLMT